MMSGEAGNIPGLDSILRGEIMRKDALVNQLLNQNKEVQTEILFGHFGIPLSPDPSLGRSMCTAHISHWLVWGWYVWLEHSCSYSRVFCLPRNQKNPFKTSGISLSSFCSPVGEEFLIQSKYSQCFCN